MEEVPTRIEPAFFEDTIPASISDLVVEIQGAASNLGKGLNQDAAYELADMVRVINCYYSNLIEGHNTRPKDIERALAGAEIEEATRPLALEARAHVIVQREIDRMALNSTLPIPTSTKFISWVHRRFYEEMPDEFRFVEHNDGTKVAIVPGEFRADIKDDVSVGRHQPPSSQRVGVFMDHFSKRYKTAQVGATNRVIAIAAAHHRLNYIHPFIDGNGRVSRLMSHAMAQTAGAGGNGLWSISRGLARGLNDKSEYKRMMDHADQPRRGDRDGRGNLSTSSLQEYCEWFLSVALDQIKFSSAVFAFDTLETRYRKLVSSISDDKRAPDVISAILRHGSMDRGDMSLITRTSERTARITLKELVDLGFLKSASPKTPVRIAFPLDYRERLFPNLFADVEVEVPKPSVPIFLRPTMKLAEIQKSKGSLNSDEFKKRAETVSNLRQSMGVRFTLGGIAYDALRGASPTDVNWQDVEDQVIIKAIGDSGASRGEVIATLSEYSPGSISVEQQENMQKRVYELAPGLVAKYNSSLKPPRPK